MPCIAMHGEMHWVRGKQAKAAFRGGIFPDLY